MNRMDCNFVSEMSKEEMLEVNGGGIVAVVAAITLKEAVKKLIIAGIATAVTGFAGGALYEWILGE